MKKLLIMYFISITNLTITSYPSVQSEYPFYPHIKPTDNYTCEVSQCKNNVMTFICTHNYENLQQTSTLDFKTIYKLKEGEDVCLESTYWKNSSDLRGKWGWTRKEKIKQWDVFFVDGIAYSGCKAITKINELNAHKEQYQSCNVPLYKLSKELAKKLGLNVENKGTISNKMAHNAMDLSPELEKELAKNLAIDTGVCDLINDNVKFYNWSDTIIDFRKLLNDIDFRKLLNENYPGLKNKIREAAFEIFRKNKMSKMDSIKPNNDNLFPYCLIGPGCQVYNKLNNQLHATCQLVSSAKYEGKPSKYIQLIQPAGIGCSLNMNNFGGGWKWDEEQCEWI